MIKFLIKNVRINKFDTRNTRLIFLASLNQLQNSYPVGKIVKKTV